MKQLELEPRERSAKVRLRPFLTKRPLADYIFDTIGDLQHAQVTSRTMVEYSKSINDLRHIHGFFRAVNEQVAMGTFFRGHFEDCTMKSFVSRRFAIPVVGKLLHGTDFILHRVIPKTRPCDRIYFAITGGRKRRLSKAEILGRLISAGFDIVKTEQHGHLTWFTVRKVSAPLDTSGVSKGWLYKMPRIGINGKIIYVYKMRTMHPYSEFLQDYLKNTHGYGPNGKIRDDFRMTSWGKFMRRYWIDEIPQIINVLKGDLRIVGVRPISRSYFNDIPEDLRELRIRQKPGCIPPYVAMNLKANVASVLKAEKDYLEIREKSPLSTDLKFFCYAIYNIIVKSKRSA